MFIKHFKLAFLSLALFALLTPTASFAVDQRCWTKSACTSGDELTRGTFYQSTETVSACQMADDLSGKPVGFCLAAGTAETKVDYGGKKIFANIGEFIKWIYKYGIQVAGILAVVMIIVAGFSWATSGGSPEKITAARKRIGGAMMGLFLAVMSYFILNMINPYMVNLRMPQVWMINTSGLSPQYCDQIKDSKKVSKGKGGPFKTEPSTAVCGEEYYVEGTPDLTCKGMYCGSAGLCVARTEKDKPAVSQCEKGAIGGSIFATKALLCSDLTSNIIDSTLNLYAMCNNTSWTINIEEVDSFSVGSNARWYLFEDTTKQKIQNACKNAGGAAGFYLGADVNDEGGGIGSVVPFCPTNKASSGIDDWFAIGRQPGTLDCNKNLALVAFDLVGKRKPDCENQGPRDCSCGTLSHKEVVKKLIANKDFVSYLFSKEELLQGFVCNIFIDRSQFPALNNTALWNNMQFDTNCDFFQTSINIGGIWKTPALLE